MRFGVLQLDRLDSAKVVEEARPLVVGGSLRKRCLVHQFIRLQEISYEVTTPDSIFSTGVVLLSNALSHLVKESVIYVAPEKTIDEDRLSLRVVPQCRCSQTRVEETANLVEISGLLVRTHVIVVTTGGDVIQAATILQRQAF